MAKVSKVVKSNGDVIMDISGDTVTADNLLVGARAHGSDGEEVNGAVNLNDYLLRAGDEMSGTLTMKAKSNSTYANVELKSTAIDRDGANPSSAITSNSALTLLDKDGERIGRIVCQRQTDGTQRLYITAYNENNNTESSNTLRLDIAKDGTASYSVTSPAAFRSAIGAAANNHNQASSTINAMTGYSKPATTSAITTSDTLNAAIGKLEKENEILRNALSQSTYFISEGTTTITDTTITDKTKCFYYIPNSVISLGNSAFYACTSLKSITIPNNVIIIGDNAFEDCISLTDITIPNSVASIDDEAFKSCTSLTSITIPNDVKRIGNSAFENCTNLTSITIPDSVTSIGWNAFYGCTSLTNIIVNKPQGSILGAPWGAPNATVTWTG